MSDLFNTVMCYCSISIRCSMTNFIGKDFILALVNITKP